jgi:Peptidase MA superfamily
MHILVLFLLFIDPQLRISAPPELAAVQKKLEAIDARRFRDIAETVGLTVQGPPIRVLLAPETSDVARKMDPWIAGFASIGEGPEEKDEMVVLFPERTPSYPNSSLEDVLRHEVAHVLIGRASAQRPIPRWFNEGLAMSVERGWRLQDEGQLVYQLAVGSRTSLDGLDRMFSGEQPEVTRAYVLSGALVHDLLQRHGAGISAEILRRMNEGASFEHAFTEAVGLTPSAAEAEFWMRQYTWAAWLPTLTSTTTLWFVVTALALLAIVRRIMKNRAIEKKWAEEGIGESREEREDVPPSED